MAFLSRSVGRILCRAVLAAGLLVSQSFAGGEPEDGATDAEAAVSAVDLRPAFAAWGLKPRRQGGRGTCSVFAITGALEFAAARKCGDGTRLSVEFLNWASNEAVGRMQDGGFFSELWRGFARYGVCPESDMPYRDAFAADLTPGEDAMEHARGALAMGLRLNWIKRWNPKTGLAGKEAEAIKEALRRGWPVCAGLRWPKRVRWRDDTLVMSPPEGVFDGHSVLLVGYRDDPEQPGGGVFFLHDSNRTERPCYMTYEYAVAYINDAVWIDCRLQDEPAQRNQD